jgi:hypothetical protein
MHPPDPEMRRAALADGPQSHLEDNTADKNIDAAAFQARRLRRLFFLAHETAGTIATLAYGVVR